MVNYTSIGKKKLMSNPPPSPRARHWQHRGAAAGIVFHPQNPSLVATAGHDGVVCCTDVRVGERKDGGGGDGVLKSIQTDAPLTCVSFHHEVLYCCCRCCCCCSSKKETNLRGQAINK